VVSAIHVTTANYLTTAGIGLGATSARLRAAYLKLDGCGLQKLCLAGRDGTGRRTVTRFDLGLTSATANYVVGISVTS